MVDAMVTAELSLLDRVFHVLSDFPSPEDVLAISATDQESNRIKELTELNLNKNLSPEEQTELDRYFLAERYVRLAKAKALIALHDDEK